MEDYVSLDEENLKFKHIISAPAPVGRILNYLILTGQGSLFHKNGNRDIQLINGIGCAWTIEFMVGLGLVTYNEKDPQPVRLSLTTNGKRIYLCLKDYKNTFDESSKIVECKKELMDYSIDAFLLFKQAFIFSPVFRNLHAFLSKKKTNIFSKHDFNNTYYLELRNYYGIKENYNPNARTPTGKNRVPSLIQICSFFGFVKETGENFIFNLPKIKETIAYQPVIQELECKNYNDVSSLVDDLSEDLAIKDASGYSDENDIKSSNNREPTLIEGDHTNHRFTTDPRLGKTAIEMANFVCELDGIDGHSHKTFESPNGHQYLEAHHLIPMKAQKDFPGKNLDRLENIVAICPNCHRAIHYGTLAEKKKYLRPLYDKRIEQLRKCAHHIDISFDDLISKYYL